MVDSKPTSRARDRKFIKRPGEFGKLIRPLVIRPRGFAVPDDPDAIKIANEEMEKLHAQAVADAWLAKLTLLLRHYDLADDDWFSLALNLAIEHEPGFQVDRQIASLPFGHSGGVHIRDGEIVSAPGGRPPEWPAERLGELLEAVSAEKKKWGLNDLDALRRLAKRAKWKAQANHRSKSERDEFDARVRTLQSRLHEAKQLKRTADALSEQLQTIRRQVGG
jgi:hypothetical protein